METECIFTDFFFIDNVRVYVDLRNMSNFEVRLLFLVAGILEDKVFRKGLIDVYIFPLPIALSKAGRF